MQFQEKEFLPVILGADITAYSLARSFHEEYGIKSLVLSMSEGGYIANSDIIENRIFPGLENKDVLVKHLIEVGKEFEGKKKLIVLGCGDWYVRALIESKKELSPYYIIPYIDVDLLNKIVLKDKFYEIFEELGLNYPKTYVYECGKENDLKFDFDYPVIAKPANSAMYHYAKFDGKKKVFRFNNEEELRDMLAKLEKSSYDYKFLIQDCIPGDDTYMRVLTCYCDQNHKVRFASLGRTLLEDHTPTAIGNPVAIVNEVNPEIVAAATKFLEHIGYTGFANFDMKYDERDGKYKLFEMNLRQGRSSYFVTAAGYNIAKWLADDVIYNKPMDLTIATNKVLYTIIPTKIIFDYCPDTAVKAEAKKLIDEGKVVNSYYYKKDRSLMRWLMFRRNQHNYFEKYKRYFNNKGLRD